MAASSPENFPKLFAKFDPSPTCLQIFAPVSLNSEEESRFTLLETQYGIVIILQNKKILADFYLVTIWQLNPVKG